MNIWLVSNSTFGNTLENALQLVGLLSVFIFILVATYFSSRMIGQYKLGQMKHKNFKVIETYKAAPNKYLQLVKMGNKYIVIAIGKDEIHVVTELSEDEVLLPIEGHQQGMKFADFITKVQGKHKFTKDMQTQSDNTEE